MNVKKTPTIKYKLKRAILQLFLIFKNEIFVYVLHLFLNTKITTRNSHIPSFKQPNKQPKIKAISTYKKHIKN